MPPVSRTFSRFDGASAIYWLYVLLRPTILFSVKHSRAEYPFKVNSHLLLLMTIFNLWSEPLSRVLVSRAGWGGSQHVKERKPHGISLGLFALCGNQSWALEILAT